MATPAYKKSAKIKASAEKRPFERVVQSRLGKTPAKKMISARVEVDKMEALLKASGYAKTPTELLAQMIDQNYDRLRFDEWIKGMKETFKEEDFDSETLRPVKL